MLSNSGVNRNHLNGPRPTSTCLFRMKIAFSPLEEVGRLLQGLKNSSGSQGTQIPVVCELFNVPLACTPVCVSRMPSLGLLKEEKGKK